MAEVLHLRGPILCERDEVRHEAWVIEGRITFTRPVDVAAEHRITTLTGWVVPGLVDAHCHVGLVADGAADRETAEQQALADRQAGTLLIRDAGSPADTRWIDERDDLPEIVRAGRHIARTRRYLRNFADEVEPGELAAAMTRQALAGDGWVKIVGDWIDRELGDLSPSFPAEAVREGIAAAHAQGARVTAHCFGEDCLPPLLEAGIDGIEHGCGFTPELIEQAARQQVAVVPTLINIDTFPRLVAPARGKFDAWAEHMMALYERRYETVGALREAGVPVYVGTDAGSAMAHGLIVDELRELLKAGFSPAEALDAGCWAARRWLGRPGLVEGAPADLLVLSGDPRLGLEPLARPEAIVLRGRAYR